jgi:hypothetical protein
MDRKRRAPMTEAVVYVYSLPKQTDKASLSAAIENALETSRAGRVVGSGTSFFDLGTLMIEIKARDEDAAEVAIAGACKQMKCVNYEVVWE